MSSKNNSEYNWEKTTKGVGRKLLEKFGFKGRLGAREDGVSSAIEVVVRPGSLGLGFGDFTEASSLKTNKKFEAEWRGKEFDDTEDENKKTFVEKLASSKTWKNKGKRKPQSEDYVMISAEEIVKRAKENFGQSKRQVILDMRGSEARILTDLSGINSNEGSSSSLAPQPKFGEQFLYNLNLVVDLSEMKLTENVNKLQQYSNRIDTVTTDITLLEKSYIKDEIQLDRLKRIEKILEKIQNKLETDISDITMDAIVKVFQTLYINFPEEFKLFGLIQILPSIVNPILKRNLSEWKPLQEPTKIVDMVLSWEGLLEMLVPSGEDKTARELLNHIMEDICLSSARRSLQNDWFVKQAEPAVRLLDALKLVISPVSFEDLLNTTVFPKIVSAVQTWSPTTDSIPIHSWILPWINLLKSRISSVFPDIRRKISHALVPWHPSDTSAAVILRPWVGVFDQTSMDQLLLRCILPKLVVAFREFQINPQNQDLSIFRSIMVWGDIIPKIHFVSLLEGEFFNRWIQVLVTWLNSNPDYEEITRWYLGWKSEFTEELLQDIQILSYFNVALQLMNDALTNQTETGIQIPKGILENISYYRVVEQKNLENAAMKRMQELQGSQNNKRANIGVSFKEVVEAYAENNNIIFIPKDGKIIGGKQIYQFGSKLCYIDQNVVFYSNGNNWSPISLEDLLLLAK